MAVQALKVAICQAILDFQMMEDHPMTRADEEEVYTLLVITHLIRGQWWLTPV